ncbi:MAG: MFS transporter [Bacteroidales bacterium]|nr:MFS transporter [Bacteroidales bacterium]
MELTPKISKNNFYSFLWHAGFLALSRPFMDVDTIIPAMLVDAGGSAVQIGIMTAIMVGGSSFTQLFFAPFISNYHYKKNFLVLGINARILALLGMGLMLIYSPHLPHPLIIWLIFILISIFSFSGAFANVSYTDILGKSVLTESRKTFFSIRQVINGVLLFLAALAAKKILSLTGYPDNYGYLFLIAFAALFVASLGLWNLKEAVPSKLSVQSPGHFLKLIGEEWQQNPRLKYFLGFINTMGISISFLPFIILFGKEIYHTQSSATGWMLLIKIIGTVTTGFLLFFLAGKYKYRYLLYGGALLTFISPLVLLLPYQLPSLAVVFFFGGIIYTAYNISMNGVLLEISGNTNRALYTGIAGAGNILPAIFPLAGGWIIKHFGFLPFFALFMIVILASLFFIYKMDCKK